MKTRLSAGVALSLLTMSAVAADVGAPANAPPGSPAFAWTGCYVGGRLSGGWGRKDATDSAGILAPTTGFESESLVTSGYLLGGQIGCDDQLAPGWVIGIQGAAAGGNIGGSNIVAQPLALAGDNATFNETTDFLSSATARLGYAWDRWLLYVKGGAAWAGDRYSAVGTFTGIPFDLQALEMRFGWTAGGGIEWAPWNAWSVRLEYDYYGFGNRSVTFIDATTGVSGSQDIRQSIQTVTLSLNLHIWAGPGPAP